MARYLPRISAVEAVQYSGDNADEIQAGCALAEASFSAPDGVSPNRRLAVWNAKRNTWDYCGKGDWLVVSEGWARVMKTDAFVAHFVAEAQVR